jgi:carboxylate-amine ligase
MLVDPGSLELASGVSRILPERTERLKTELFECVVETTTPVCESAAEVLDELRGLRAEVARRAHGHGLELLASGSHPFSRGMDQEIVPEDRYAKMKAELGPAIYRQIVCGLHVHVGMPDPEACLRAFEGVLRWLPEVLSLAANSPYLEGEETGVRSGRATRLAELPRSQAPPVFRSWDEWETFTAGRDYTRMWWDIRPHPRLGTLEVRMADQQTDVRRSAALAALVQAVASDTMDGPLQIADREDYARRRLEGAAGDLPLDGLREAAERAARRLETWPVVERLLDEPAEAERQLAVGDGGDLRAVAADLVERTAAWRRPGGTRHRT